MMRAALVCSCAVLVGLAGAQPLPIAVMREGTNVVAQADNVVFRGTDNTVIADIRSVVASLASVNTSAQYASDSSALNQQAIGTMNGVMTSMSQQMSTALSSQQAQISTLQSMLTAATDAIARLESGAQASCDSICVNGNCQSRINGSHTYYECVCTAPYYGPNCDRTYAPTTAPTNRPTGAPTLQQISSCASAPSSGTYSITTGGGFDAYCLVGPSGRKWMRIVRWPSNIYTMTTSAVNGTGCALANPSTFCKLSDTQINSVISAGSSRYYWLDTAQYPESVYIRTPRPYADTTVSFGTGAGQATTIGRVSNGFPNPFVGTTFARPFIDFYWVNNATFATLQTCQRFFIGHGANDCWSGPTGQRCIRSGASCGNHAPVSDWNMYISAV